MKIKEVQAGVKVSRNYNSYSISLVADMEGSESPEKVGEVLIERAREIVSKKIQENENTDLKVSAKQTQTEKSHEEEVGAAWPDKKSEEKLSVKYSGSEEWHDVNVSDLEKTNEGYKQRVGEDVFVFRKIPSEKRKNPKMPTFRIYKTGKNIQENKMKGGKI